MLDLLIRGGLVIDGTGNPGFYGAVAVEGERVRILRGDTSGIEARRRIDATGHVVCPGFIDMHAHSGLVILAEPHHEPKVRQGITTELIGIDGNSYAPFHSHDDFLRFVQLNSGLDGNPPLPGRWSTVAEYLDMFTAAVAVNIVYIVGNSPLRIGALGWDDRPATRDELANMKALLREAMEEGAFGMSTGLDYPPGSYADTAELIELSREAARLGGIYHTHVRYSLGDRFLDPFREALDIGRGSDIPVHITHFYHRTTSAGGASRMLGLVEDARETGPRRHLRQLPLHLRRHAAAHPGAPVGARRRARAADRRAPRSRDARSGSGGTWARGRARGATCGSPTSSKPAQPPIRGALHPAGRRHARAATPSTSSATCCVDEDLEISYVSAGGNLATLPKFVSHPLSMVGSDALLIGDYPSPRTYGCFPIILAEFVREERFLALPDAIRKMTSFPAQRLGLPDRGLLRDGFKADVVVFDAKTVKAPATRTQPKQFPIGIDYVIVNGQVVIDGGRHTGVLAGRALRRGRAST